MTGASWSDTLLTGLSAIDEDHKKLISILNNMENISSVNESRAQMREIITSLIDYTKYHFGREEKLMQVAVGYRDIEKHKREHAMFIEKVEKYVSAFCAGQEFSEDITVFLYSWLVNHINGTDKALAEKLT